MRKYAYLAQLEELLAALPPQERQDALNYYEEYFDAAGNENEEKTAEELGDPATVARKILEEEGAVETEGAAQAAAAPPQRKESPEPMTQPEGPEPPALEKPEQYPTSGVPSYDGKKPNRKGPRLWLIFWLVVILALVVQISVLLLNVSGLGGSSASTTASVEYAASEPVPSTALTQEKPRPTDANGSSEGALTYSSALDAPGKGKLFINMICGNLVLRTGEEASVQVCNADASEEISYNQTVDYGYTFVCNSTAPDTQVTITLPPQAFHSVEVMISTNGTIDLGDLQINQIDAFTADGVIRSGVLQTAKLNVQTGSGDIRLDKIADNADYETTDVSLQALHGSVTANFSAPRDQWKAVITAQEGISETLANDQKSEDAPRTLEVLAEGTADLQYGVQ